MRRHARSSSTSLAVVLLSLGAMAFALVAAGCAGGGGGTTSTTQGAGQPSPSQLLVSQKTRSAAGATPEELQDLVSGNTAFALDLLQTLAKPGSPTAGDNLVISPYSISIALAMTYAGAHGATAEEMAKVLHFTLAPERLHAAFNALDQAIAARNRDFPANTDGQEPARVELNVVNQLWAQQDFAFLPAFLDLLAADYGAGLRVLDFVQDAESARQTINGWVADATKDRIEDLLPDGSVDASTRLVLTNAVYLKAPWATTFEKAADGGRRFPPAGRHQRDGAVHAPVRDPGLRGRRGVAGPRTPLPRERTAHGGAGPRRSQAGRVHREPRRGHAGEDLSSLEQQTVDLALPKFEARSALALKDALEALGMPTAFSDAADFSGMTGRPRPRHRLRHPRRLRLRGRGRHRGGGRNRGRHEGDVGAPRQTDRGGRPALPLADPRRGDGRHLVHGPGYGPAGGRLRRSATPMSRASSASPTVTPRRIQ